MRIITLKRAIVYYEPYERAVQNREKVQEVERRLGLAYREGVSGLRFTVIQTSFFQYQVQEERRRQVLLQPLLQRRVCDCLVAG